MTNRTLAILALALAAALPLHAQEEQPTAEDQARLAETVVAPSLVRVEYTLQYDAGEPPQATGWGEDGFDWWGHGGEGAEGLIRQERPLELPGFVLPPGRVVSPDPMIHPRFIKRIAVRFGDGVVEAKPAAYARGQGAVFLDLAGPLAGTVPLDFAAQAPQGPYLGVTYLNKEGAWTIGVQPLSFAVAVAGKDRRYSKAPSPSLIITGEGKAVAVTIDGELPVDGSWKTSPTNWPVVGALEMEKLLKEVEAAALRGLPRVDLHFRSPRAQAGRGGRFNRYGGGEEGEDAAYRNVLGLLVDDRQVVVLSYLRKNVTARLEKIQVQFPDGKSVSAKFVRSLADYGCFVAALEEPVQGAMAFSSVGMPEARRDLLLAADLKLQGEKRVAYFNRRRMAALSTGWKGRLYPEMGGEEGTGFVFDLKGALLALPLVRREKVEDERSRWRVEMATIPAAHLKEALADRPENAAPGNVPLSEEEENRICWMGVELQALNKELARANNVSELTRDGESGALVCYVYPGSPAGAAGIEPGTVLLRLHIEGVPQPVEVQVEDSPFSFRSFPWDQYDQLTEDNFEHVPVPWIPVQNTLNVMLTELGSGKSYKAEFFHAGQVVFKEFKVEACPTHYEAAPRSKSAPLGMTVRDLTFDVRRYFQMEPADSGVVISKIEPGSKASVAGLKPYEIVTRVNDVPVADAKDFLARAEGQAELRLSIKRMTKTRLVKIRLGGGEEDKPKAPEPPQEMDPEAK